jgi:hypothetical protein
MNKEAFWNTWFDLNVYSRGVVWKLFVQDLKDCKEIGEKRARVVTLSCFS